MKHQALPIGKNRMSSQVHNATVMVDSLAPDCPSVMSSKKQLLDYVQSFMNFCIL